MTEASTTQTGQDLTEQTPVDSAVQTEAKSLQERLAELLGTGGDLTLDQLSSIEKLVKDSQAKIRAEEQAQRESVRRAKRVEQITALVDRMPSFTDAELEDFRGSGLLGVTIVFPAKPGDSIGYKPVEATPQATATKRERAVGADGSTPAKSTAGSGPKPGDKATYAQLTGLPEGTYLPEDEAEITKRVDEAMEKGSFGGDRGK